VKIIKITIGDQEYNAVERDFEIAREEWNQYRLLDGGTVRVKTSVQKILLIVDENGNPTRTADGDLNVLVRHATEVVSSE